jgi:hypothetical protein
VITKEQEINGAFSDKKINSKIIIFFNNPKK